MLLPVLHFAATRSYKEHSKLLLVVCFGQLKYWCLGYWFDQIGVGLRKGISLIVGLYFLWIGFMNVGVVDTLNYLVILLLAFRIYRVWGVY